MLKHPAVLAQKRHYFELYDAIAQDPDKKTLSAWIETIESLARKFDEDEALKFKGDNLEVLSEIFFNCFHADESVGLTSYIPTPLEEDYGVDATGVNPVGRKCAVQCKYKSFQPVLYEELAKTFSSALLNMNCDVLSPNSIYVFTTAMTQSTAIDKVFGNRVRMINHPVITRKINHNETFWDYALNEIFDTIEQ
jgi:hypothetical protein